MTQSSRRLIGPANKCLTALRQSAQIDRYATTEAVVTAASAVASSRTGQTVRNGRPEENTSLAVNAQTVNYVISVVNHFRLISQRCPVDGTSEVSAQLW